MRRTFILAAIVILLVAYFIPSLLYAQVSPQIMTGAWMNGQSGFANAPWDQRTIDLFESHTGKKLSIIHWGQQWWRNGTYQPMRWSFPYIDAMRTRGSLSLIDWTPWDTSILPLTNQPKFSLAAIIRGDHDIYIKESALAAKTYSKSYFIRMMHEMNGDWYPWSTGQNGNQSGDFVKAWRHIVDIFKSTGANNVNWVWCPNVSYPGSTPLTELYPGDAYVDWTCLDGYNFGGSNWRTFEVTYTPTYAELQQLAPTKPIMIGEVGSTEFGGNKADWITEMFKVLPDKFPNIKAINWFNWSVDGHDWIIESAPSSQEAYRKAMESPIYAANLLTAPLTGKIPPLQPVVTRTPTWTPTLPPTRTNTPSPTLTPTRTFSPTSSPMPTNTVTPTNTATPTPTPTLTLTPTATLKPPCLEWSVLRQSEDEILLGCSRR